MHLLDTDILIYAQKKRSLNVIQKIKHHAQKICSWVQKEP